MARARNRSSGFRRSAPNRGWSGFTTPAFVAVPAATKVLLGTFVLFNPGIDETILRTVGMLAVVSDQLVVTEAQIGAFGFIGVTDIAAAAGAASIPGPVTDAGDDWFLYVPFASQFTLASAASFQAVGFSNISFDSKAKRKFDEGTTIALMIENANATQGFNAVFSLRMLSMVSGT